MSRKLSHSDVSEDTGDARAKLDTLRLAAYAGRRLGPVNLAGTLGYATTRCFTPATSRPSPYRPGSITTSRQNTRLALRTQPTWSMILNKPAASKRTTLPRASDYTKEFLKGWQNG